MKLVATISFSLLLFGCASPSRYAHDPRAHCIGPDYLDYIDQYPPDKATQYYYVSFRATGASSVAEPQPSNFAPEVRALLIAPPPPTDEAKANTGKGWPELESNGVPFFCKQEP